MSDIFEDQEFIVLPTEEWRVLALKDKLAEYQGRLSRKIAIPWQAEEDAADKFITIELLLAKGRVSIEEVAQARKEHPRFHEYWNEYNLQGDFNVIAAYCLGREAEARGGTGFPRKGSGIQVPQTEA